MRAYWPEREVNQDELMGPAKVSGASRISVTMDCFVAYQVREA